MSLNWITVLCHTVVNGANADCTRSLNNASCRPILDDWPCEKNAKKRDEHWLTHAPKYSCPTTPIRFFVPETPIHAFGPCYCGVSSTDNKRQTVMSFVCRMKSRHLFKTAPPTLYITAFIVSTSSITLAILNSCTLYLSGRDLLSHLRNMFQEGSFRS